MGWDGVCSALRLAMALLPLDIRLVSISFAHLFFFFAFLDFRANLGQLPHGT